MSEDYTNAKTCVGWCPHVKDKFCTCCDCLILKEIHHLPKGWKIVEGVIVKDE